MKLNTTIHIYLFMIIFGLSSVNSASISEQLEKIEGKNLVIGASSFLVGFIYKLMKSVKVKQPMENYSAMYRRFAQDESKTKELEVLTYFAHTYKKDIVNKCKIAVKMWIKDQTEPEREIEQYFKLCQRWGQFVIDNIHQSSGVYDVEKAFYYFSMQVEKELNWSRVDLEKLKRDPDSNKSAKIDAGKNENNAQNDRLKNLTRVLEAHFDLTRNTQTNLKDYPIDFSLVKSFYSNYFEPFFSDLLTTGELQRYTVSLNSKGADFLDKLFAITDRQIESENRRIAMGKRISQVDNFKDVNSKSLYRYYLPGWHEPLVNVYDDYPTLNE